MLADNCVVLKAAFDVVFFETAYVLGKVTIAWDLPQLVSEPMCEEVNF